MNYILLAISMSVALLSGIGAKYYISTYNKGQHTNHIYNSIVGFFCIITLFLWNDGFKISRQIAKENNMYAQNYCGCKFSIRN